MNHWIAIGIGGAAGSMLRYALSTWTHTILGRGFPYGTLAVNVLGCFAMGVLYIVFAERFADNAVWRSGILIGVLGGFTTFSAFSIETFRLMDDGEPLKAVSNVLLSVALCIGATWLGVLLARQSQ
jgi:CrcB protein